MNQHAIADITPARRTVSSETIQQQIAELVRQTGEELQEHQRRQIEALQGAATKALAGNLTALYKLRQEWNL